MIYRVELTAEILGILTPAWLCTTSPQLSIMVLVRLLPRGNSRYRYLDCNVELIGLDRNATNHAHRGHFSWHDRIWAWLKDITNDLCKSLDRRYQSTYHGIWLESGKDRSAAPWRRQAVISVLTLGVLVFSRMPIALSDKSRHSTHRFPKHPALCGWA